MTDLLIRYPFAEEFNTLEAEWDHECDDTPSVTEALSEAHTALYRAEDMRFGPLRDQQLARARDALQRAGRRGLAAVVDAAIGYIGGGDDDLRGVMRSLWP